MRSVVDVESLLYFFFFGPLAHGPREERTTENVNLERGREENKRQTNTATMGNTLDAIDSGPVVRRLPAGYQPCVTDHPEGCRLYEYVYDRAHQRFRRRRRRLLLGEVPTARPGLPGTVADAPGAERHAAAAEAPTRPDRGEGRRRRHTVTAEEWERATEVYEATYDGPQQQQQAARGQLYRVVQGDTTRILLHWSEAMPPPPLVPLSVARYLHAMLQQQQPGMVTDPAGTPVRAPSSSSSWASDPPTTTTTTTGGESLPPLPMEDEDEEEEDDDEEDEEGAEDATHLGALLAAVRTQVAEAHLEPATNPVGWVTPRGGGENPTASQLDLHFARLHDLLRAAPKAADALRQPPARRYLRMFLGEVVWNRGEYPLPVRDMRTGEALDPADEPWVRDVVAEVIEGLPRKRGREGDPAAADPRLRRDDIADHVVRWFHRLLLHLAMADERLQPSPELLRRLVPTMRATAHRECLDAGRCPADDHDDDSIQPQAKQARRAAAAAARGRPRPPPLKPTLLGKRGSGGGGAAASLQPLGVSPTAAWTRLETRLDPLDLKELGDAARACIRQRLGSQPLGADARPPRWVRELVPGPRDRDPVAWCVDAHVERIKTLSTQAGERPWQVQRIGWLAYICAEVCHDLGIPSVDQKAPSWREHVKKHTEAAMPAVVAGGGGASPTQAWTVAEEVLAWVARLVAPPTQVYVRSPGEVAHALIVRQLRSQPQQATTTGSAAGSTPAAELVRQVSDAVRRQLPGGTTGDHALSLPVWVRETLPAGSSSSSTVWQGDPVEATARAYVGRLLHTRRGEPLPSSSVSPLATAVRGEVTAGLRETPEASPSDDAEVQALFAAVVPAVGAAPGRRDPTRWSPTASQVRAVCQEVLRWMARMNVDGNGDARNRWQVAQDLVHEHLGLMKAAVMTAAAGEQDPDDSPDDGPLGVFPELRGLRARILERFHGQGDVDARSWSARVDQHLVRIGCLARKYPEYPVLQEPDSVAAFVADWCTRDGPPPAAAVPLGRGLDGDPCAPLSADEVKLIREAVVRADVAPPGMDVDVDALVRETDRWWCHLWYRLDQPNHAHWMSHRTTVIVNLVLCQLAMQW